MPDLLIGAALLALVAASIRKLVADKKRGKSCCGHCAGCTMRCERYEERKEEETP